MYNDSYTRIEQIVSEIHEKFGTYDPYEIAAKCNIELIYTTLPEQIHTILFKQENKILLLVQDTMIQEYKEYLITYALAQFFLHGDFTSYTTTQYELTESDFTKEIEENYIFSFYLLKKYHKGITDEEMIKKYRVRENLKRFML